MNKSLLVAAKRQADLAEEIQEEDLDLDHSERRNKLLRGMVASSCVTAFAFLEATINQEIHYLVVGTDCPASESLGESWDDARSTMTMFQNVGALRQPHTLNLYNIYLSVIGLDVLDSGSQPFQDADLLRRLRNEIVHYKPYEETLVSTIPDIEESDHKMAARLDGKFDLNPWHEDANTTFWNEYLSAGCSRWAISTVEVFATEFYDRLGVDIAL